MTSCEICGRQKGDMNATNWTRHVNSCKSKIPTSKRNLSNISIKHFFLKKQKVENIGTDNHTTTEQQLNIVTNKPIKCPAAYIISVPEVNCDSAEPCESIGVGSYDIDIDNCTLTDQVLDSPNIPSTIVHVEVNDDLVEQTSLSGVGSYSIDIDNCTLTDQVLDSPNIISPTVHVEVNNDLVEQTSLTAMVPRENIFPNDPVNWPEIVSYQLLSHFVELGPCQPSPLDLKLNAFPKRKDSNGNLRSFHENYYFKRLEDGTFCKRTWLSYSPSLDRFFCMTCKLFGLVKAKTSFLATTGSCDFRNISKNINLHESLPEHIQSEISRGLYASNTRIDVTLLESANRQVAENRKIIEVIIDALVYTARQNIAIRGHSECVDSNNRGNFLELLGLLGKYHAPLNAHLQKINTKKCNRLTFLSAESQNKMLSILAEIVRSKILWDIKKSNLFSVIIDTTTDLSNKEQFTFLMRYVNEQGNIEERLVALVTAPDSTGRGLFEVFCNITEKYGIDWKKRLCAQAYDGAASMQGKYSGLKTFIQNENPNALYVWCSAHLLNLVIVDTCDCCIVTKVFFGDIRALVEFMRARKRTASFIEWQQQLYQNQRIRRLKRFSNTRWTSHDRVIVVVYEKYAALLKALNSIASANDSDGDTSSTAKSLILRISSFNFVSTMVFIRQIFSITTPVSNYLQSKSIDFIQAIKLVDIAKKRLEDLRLDNNALEKILNEAKQFAFDHKLLEQDFKEKRIRKKKIMPGELSGDDISPSSIDNFRRDVYYKVLDIIINSLDSRFKDSREVMIDLSLLSPERLMSYRQCGGKSLPDDAFQSVSKWIKNIDLNKLKVEYLTFSSSLNELIDGLRPKQLHNITSTLNTNEEENDSENTYSENSESEDKESKNENVNVEKILHILSSHDLITAFPNLYTAYKSLGTIPASSASAERSFSKVKLIKTRLRSTVGQNRLESLVLLSTEKDIAIDYNEAINKFALTSDLLTKELMFK